jgi:hypothetical protein
LVALIEVNDVMVNKTVIDELSYGYFPGIRVLKADVSEHCVGSIFKETAI